MSTTTYTTATLMIESWLWHLLAAAVKLLWLRTDIEMSSSTSLEIHHGSIFHVQLPLCTL